MKKFNRVYRLSVETGPNTQFAVPLRNGPGNVTIQSPDYTCAFSIQRQNLSQAQTASFRVYNLPPEIRDSIKKDVYNAGELRAVQFWAGYSNDEGSEIPLCFNGTVSMCNSAREGQDWITTIDAFDGGWQIINGVVSLSLAAGQTAAQAIQTLCQYIPSLTGSPIIGTFPIQNLRGEVFVGNPWDFVVQKSAGNVTIDNGQVKALQPWECFASSFSTIDESSGVIGTPRVSGVIIEMDMIFEPNVSVCQIINLKLNATPKLNRAWKVLGFDHTGTISHYGLGGEARTTLRLWYATQELSVIFGSPFLDPITFNG